MFGYIRPQKPELLVREFEQYRGVYCSLCKQMGKSYGALARLFLSYDCTFYALMLMGLSGNCTGFVRGRCVVNPMKACNYCKEERDELKLASALSAVMTYNKLKDDQSDGKALKKMRALLFLPVAAYGRKKAAKVHPALNQAASNYLAAQGLVESSEQPGLDFCAEPTAQMLAQAFVYGAGRVCGEENPDSPLLRLCSEFGYHLGRWVYLIDAADDLEKDLHDGNFNPFLLKFGLVSGAEEDSLKMAREYANQLLNQSVARMSAAMELFAFQSFGPVIKNIVTLGLPEMQRQTLFDRKTKASARSAKDEDPAGSAFTE